MITVRALAARRINSPDDCRVILVETLGTIVGMAVAPSPRFAIENPTVDVQWHNSIVVRRDTGATRIESDYVERGVCFADVACLGNPSGTYGAIAPTATEGVDR